MIGLCYTMQRKTSLHHNQVHHTEANEKTGAHLHITPTVREEGEWVPVNGNKLPPNKNQTILFQTQEEEENQLLEMPQGYILSYNIFFSGDRMNVRLISLEMSNWNNFCLTLINAQHVFSRFYCSKKQACSALRL